MMSTPLTPPPLIPAAAAAAQAPVVVLVRPQLGQNIGAAARAMLNFGLEDLRLVNPRDGWPNPDAGPSASGADAVLAGARVFETVADAVADVGFVYAATVRHRGMTKPVVTPFEAARDMRARGGGSAILFGPERSGLESQDVAACHAVMTVPVNPAFASLNLAQAVLIAGYEWWRAAAAAAPPIDNYEGPAPHRELDALVAAFDGALEAAGYFRVAARAAASRRTMRNLLTRPAYSANEVRTWRGILTALTRPRRLPPSPG